MPLLVIRKKNRCSRCKNFGHIRSNKKCPVFVREQVRPLSQTIRLFAERENTDFVQQRLNNIVTSSFQIPSTFNREFFENSETEIDDLENEIELALKEAEEIIDNEF